LAGVECDGASYHSGATARDRDRLRQMKLEDLGWKLHRVWSTEWWRRPREEIDRLHKRLGEQLADAHV
jgi:very-short-patch-repair endonuclease